MSFIYEGMGDHMRVGPQYVVPADRGVPIIQRGPHGQRLAPNMSQGKDGLHWWRENLYHGQAPRSERQKITGVMGMGATFGEAPTKTKVKLTKLAAQLVKDSKSKTGNALQAVSSTAAGALAELESYQAWSQSSGNWTPTALFYGSWDSSQVVRTNLQLAGMNVSRRSAGRAVLPVGPVKSVSVLNETVKAYPAAVRDRSREIQRGEWLTPEQYQSVPGLDSFLNFGKQAKEDAQKWRNYIILGGAAVLAAYVYANR